MVDYYKKVVFENYANFNGRARRSEYWYFVLMNIIIGIVIGIIEGILGLGEFRSSSSSFYMSGGIISNLYNLAVLVPSIAVAVRRMHDVGKSGWFILIPIYNLVLAATEGDKGTNEYGPDPKNPEFETEDHLLD
ncbi:MAG: DUF805 domain-containing protein [Flavobacteriales bacterium]|nr:DUF805 domain-containing protein [Flavobacteriales bacterium]